MTEIREPILPPPQALMDHWDAIIDYPVGRGNHDMLADEKRLEYFASAAAQEHPSERYKSGNRVTHVRICQRRGCEIHFLTKRPSAKYCSRKCSQRQPQLPMKRCQFIRCQELFQPMRRTARYCVGCRQRARRFNRVQ
jgi:hypothetical protein